MRILPCLLFKRGTGAPLTLVGKTLDVGDVMPDASLADGKLLDIKETGLLARSVWVIGPDGKIAYRQIVEDQGTEPDYDALVAAAKRAAGA